MRRSVDFECGGGGVGYWAALEDCGGELYQDQYDSHGVLVQREEDGDF